jgi:hypothetical protein
MLSVASRQRFPELAANSQIPTMKRVRIGEGEFECGTGSQNKLTETTMAPSRRDSASARVLCNAESSRHHSVAATLLAGLAASERAALEQKKRRWATQQRIKNAFRGKGSYQIASLANDDFGIDQSGLGCQAIDVQT